MTLNIVVKIKYRILCNVNMRLAFTEEGHVFAKIKGVKLFGRMKLSILLSKELDTKGKVEYIATNGYRC